MKRVNWSKVAIGTKLIVFQPWSRSEVKTTFLEYRPEQKAIIVSVREKRGDCAAAHYTKYCRLI